MRISKQKDKTGKVLSYTMWLSADDTYNWAAVWPCSDLRNRKIKAMVDSNGLYHCAISPLNGKGFNESSDSEFEAIIRDHLPYDCRHLWPMWGEEK